MAATAKVLIADDDDDVLGMLDGLFREHSDRFEVVALCSNGKVAVEEARRHRPQLVLLDVKMPEKDGITACREIRELDPETVILMISAVGDEEYVRKATEAGARDYITKPFRVAALLETIDRELELAHQLRTSLQSRPGQGERLSRVWAFWSPRSGVGTTSLAINAALELVRANQSTLFVDLNVVFPDSEQLLGLGQMYNLTDLIDHEGAMDPSSARTRIESHASGLRCLYQHDPEESVKLTPKHVEALLYGLGGQYRYLVLDLPADLGDRTGAALEVADTLWLVAGPDPVAARNITKALGLFHRLGYPRSKIRLLVNRVGRRQESLIRSLLPDEPEAVFPEEEAAFSEAVRTAYPAVLSSPSSGFSRRMKQLVAQCLALTTPEGVASQSLKDRFLALIGAG